MLEINPEIVCSVIEKSKQFHVKEDVVIPEPPLNHEDYNLYEILVDYKDDPTYREFISIIDDLEPDQRIIIVALMWLGRGDFAKNEWNIAKENAKSMKSNQIANYLLSHPLLANYLEEGLEIFGYTCE